MASKFTQKLRLSTQNADPSNPDNKNYNKDFLLQKDSKNSGIMDSYINRLQIEDKQSIIDYNQKIKDKSSNVKNNKG